MSYGREWAEVVMLGRGGAWTAGWDGIGAHGDSVTSAGQVGATDRWHYLLGQSTGETIRVIGKASGKTGWALDRDLDEDVPSTYAPISNWSYRRDRIYLIQFGLNDQATSYKDELTPAERLAFFQTQTLELIAICQGRGGVPVLATSHKLPPSYTGYAARNVLTDQYGQVYRDLAAAMNGVYVIDLYARFEIEIGIDPNFIQGPTDLHLNILGNSIQADEHETQLTALGLLP